MKYVIAVLIFLSSSLVLANDYHASCQSGPRWLRQYCKRLHQVWYEGTNELYITGYSWHNRYTYTPDRLQIYNELAWGGGLGKDFYDEDGDLHSIAAFAFLDSYKYLEPVVGYAFFKMLHINTKASIGAGYSLLVTQRPDILNGIPFPGALPWLIFNYQRASVAVTYIPGMSGIGNIAFIMAKWTL